nr:serine/threonine protein kinase [Deltaproteobacteria bacterium]
MTGRYFLAQPYLEAETLRAVVERDAPMAWDDAAAILYPVMSALAAAHVAGVIHRDVKPENILVGRRDGAPHPLLIDSGMCKASHGRWHAADRPGVVMGTPAYIPPEQAAGERDLDARADIWSVAAVWFELLTGTPPFVDALPGRLLARVITEDSPPIALSRPDLPAALRGHRSRPRSLPVAALRLDGVLLCGAARSAPGRLDRPSSGRPAATRGPDRCAVTIPRCHAPGSAARASARRRAPSRSARSPHASCPVRCSRSRHGAAAAAGSRTAEADPPCADPASLPGA